MTVLKVYTKVYENIIKLGNEIIELATKKQESKRLRHFYSEGSHIYMMDIMFWNAMVQSRDQIQYKPQEHEDWQLVNQHYEKMSLGSDE